MLSYWPENVSIIVIIIDYLTLPHDAPTHRYTGTTRLSDKRKTVELPKMLSEAGENNLIRSVLIANLYKSVCAHSILILIHYYTYYYYYVNFYTNNFSFL